MCWTIVNKGQRKFRAEVCFPHSLAELHCAISMRLCYEMAIAAPIFPGHRHRFARMTRDIGSTPAKAAWASPLNQTTKPNPCLKKGSYGRIHAVFSEPVPLVRKGDTQAVGLQWRSED